MLLGGFNSTGYVTFRWAEPLVFSGSASIKGGKRGDESESPRAAVSDLTIAAVRVFLPGILTAPRQAFLSGAPESARLPSLHAGRRLLGFTDVAFRLGPLWDDW